MGVHRHQSISTLCSSLKFARLAMVKPADARNCDYFSHFSRFYRPLFGSVLF